MNEMIARVRTFFKQLERSDIAVVLVVILVGFASFGLGRLSTMEQNREAVQIRYPGGGEAATLQAVSGIRREGDSGNNSPTALPEGGLVGSKNSDKYHFPWCPGAQRIKDENKVFFESRAAAEAAGYSPAGNCPGLE